MGSNHDAMVDREVAAANADALPPERVAFFLEHAGYSYNPATETPEQGRLRTARELARAELELEAGSFRVVWEADPDGRLSAGELEAPDAEYWQAVLVSTDVPGYHTGESDGAVVGALGGVDAPAGHPYRRVAAAELMLEHLAELEATR